ncbi:hypothetical protein E2C01_011761 [Portunus trituberculatus]|uniref:Uncharacterized protein n=1 Tax=Portunus trituberculatus TaxID=210409 RepID=A0A5B7DCD4_PORTR|nr:hypothetical protein [Portunus trituberculatus]
MNEGKYEHVTVVTCIMLTSHTRAAHDCLPIAPVTEGSPYFLSSSRLTYSSRLPPSLTSASPSPACHVHSLHPSRCTCLAAHPPPVTLRGRIPSHCLIKNFQKKENVVLSGGM